LRSKKKNKNKNNKRSAYWRGEKMTIFFRRGMIALAALIIVAVIGLGVKLAARTFTVKKIIVAGNYHLDNAEVIKSSMIKEGDSLVDLSFSDVKENFRKNAWIREVSLRKQFPDTVSIKIEESAPKVLLKLKGDIFLADEGGRVLEKVDDPSTSFLPVINDIDPQKEREALSEAIKLVDALSEKGILEGKESVEIGLESYGLAMKMDGEIFKVGYKDYAEKFEKWKVLEPEVRQRGGAIKYVDLRFDDVIVKPVRKARK
jgi:cell division septal protein FtsQ